MIHIIHFVTFTKTAITQRWLRDGSSWRKTGGFGSPLSTPQLGKVYIFADSAWPFYVGKASQRLGSRLGGGFRATPEHRIAGFAGYRFKQHMTNAFLHVFMGPPASPWSSIEAECIEAEVVFRIRQAGAWPKYQTEIHFAEAKPVHTTAADEIMAYFGTLRKRNGLNSPTDI